MVTVSYARKLLRSFRVKVFLCVFAGLFAVYKIVPRFLFKTPWTYAGWRDTEFRPDADIKEIIILKWTSVWGAREDAEVLTEEKCPYLRPSPREIFNIPCRLSYDRRYYKASEALVFHSYDLMREEVPQERSPNQIWVYVQQESPIYTKLDLEEYTNVFNWTMTYRRDSDVYYPYGRIALSEPDSSSPAATSNAKSKFLEFAKRPNLIAWIVSSCDSHSGREYLAHQLQKYVQVNIFGRCGQDCPSYNGDCYAHVSKTHKFYLSFENSLCLDYITEKFFYALEANMVPVVYGGASSEDYEAIAPPGSYIDVRKFRSAKQLAEYLTFLDQNDDAYMKYFEWKAKYKMIPREGWCNLCQRVFEHFQFAPVHVPTSSGRKQRHTRKWYRNLWAWWNYKSVNKVGEELEKAENFIGIGNVIGPSYIYNLESSSCKLPLQNFTEHERSFVGFEPGFMKSTYKFGKWLKEMLLG